MDTLQKICISYWETEKYNPQSKLVIALKHVSSLF